MTSALFVRSGGAWKSVTTSFNVHSGGAWKTIKAGFVHSGGSWKQFFAGLATPSNNYTSQFTVAGSSVSPQIALMSDGTSTYHAPSNTAGANWASPTTTGIGSSYWIKAVNVSGTGTMSGTFGSWVSLSAGQSWSMTAPTVGNALSRHCTYQIASDSGGVTVVSSGSMDFLSDRS